jgi:uncharacterized RDD family membrane protein YckC
VTDQQGSWDLEFEPWRGALAPRGEAPARGVNLAELPIRGISFLIDVLLIQQASALVFQVFSFVTLHTILLAASGGVTDPVLSTWIAFGIPLVGLGAIQAIAYVFLWRVYRASPGQMVLGLFTLDAKRGTALTKRQAFLRWLVLLLPALIMSSGDAIGYVGHYAVSLNVEQAVFSGMAVLIPFIWFVILTITILLNPRGRGLHDRLARSTVVRREGSAS